MNFVKMRLEVFLKTPSQRVNTPSKLFQDAFWAVLFGVFLSGALGIKGGWATPPAAPRVPKKVVLMTQIVEHPALNAVREGIQKVLEDKAKDQGVALELVYENAQGSLPLAGQLAKKFAGEKADVIVAISTPSAQTLKAALRGKTPLIFTALTDPIGAKLVKDLEAPGENITGVTDLPPFDQQMAFIKKLVPDLTRLGVLYNPGEANAVASVALLKKALTALDIEVVPAPVNRSSEVNQATKRLLKQVEAIYIPNDNTVVSGLEAAIRICHEAQMPLFAADILLVERGLVGMIGFDYHAIGYQTGTLVQRILDGEEAGTIAVENPDTLKLVLNPAAAEKMGISFDQDLLQAADDLK